MTKKIDETELIKDFHKGKLYAEIALKHKSSIGTISYRLRKLGLGRNRQVKEIFSREEKRFMRSLIDTCQGRKQLLNILRGK